MNKIILEDGQEIILTITKLDISRKSRMTEHKVEEGSNKSDHITQDNDSISMDIVISECGATDRSNDDWLTEFNKLKEIYYKKIPFKLVTNRDTTENLFILDFPDSRTAKDGNSIRTTLQLGKMNIAKSKTVTNSKIKDQQTKDRLFSKNVSGLKTLTPANLSLTNGTNKLIDTNLSEYKPKFQL